MHWIRGIARSLHGRANTKQHSTMVPILLPGYQVQWETRIGKAKLQTRGRCCLEQRIANRRDSGVDLDGAEVLAAEHRKRTGRGC